MSFSTRRQGCAGAGVTAPGEERRRVGWSGVAQAPGAGRPGCRAGARSCAGGRARVCAALRSLSVR